MKARKIFLGLSALAMMAFVTGCSDDLHPEVNQGGDIGAEDGPGVYMGVNFTMPAADGTRSFTQPDGDNDGSNDGFEVSSDVENNVNEVLLILTRSDDDGFIASSLVPKNSLSTHVGTNYKQPTYHARAKFSTANLSEFYADVVANKIQKNEAGNCEVNVYVVCNPTSTIVDHMVKGEGDNDGNDKREYVEYGNKKWYTLESEVDVREGQQLEGIIWSTANGGSFLMSNSRKATREIPGDENAWEAYSTAEHCFHLSGDNGNIDNSKNGGPVLVERAAARIDFKDGSKDKDGKPNNNTYDVLYTYRNRVEDTPGEDDVPTNPGEKEDLIISVQLTKMALVNMSKKFYYFPRVSDNGLNEGAGWELCGPEKQWFTSLPGSTSATGGNYVVGPNASAFNTGVTSDFGNYFNYPFFDNDGTFNNTSMALADRWGAVLISDVLKRDNDLWRDKSYHIWRYTTENVIPGIEQQKNGISTGVVFKGKMIGNTDPDALARLPENEQQVIKALNDNTTEAVQDDAPILFKYAGRMYYTFDNVYKETLAASFDYSFNDKGEVIPSWNRANSLYQLVFGNGGTGMALVKEADGKYKRMYIEDVPEEQRKNIVYEDKEKPVSNDCCWYLWRAYEADKTADNMKAFKAKATDSENGKVTPFTLYQRSRDTEAAGGYGYYCYYYHWIRHNDNGRNGIMGPMEFDVVRNNVYKLCVTSIKELGHPRISENDPDKPTPDTPDESQNIYMTVDAHVIPWVVRVNDIVFE